MVQPALDRHGDYLITAAQPPLGGRVWHRDALADTLVRPRPVEVADVLHEDATEVPLAEEQDVVQILPPDATQEALTDGVDPRRSRRRAEDLDAARGRDAGEVGPELPVVVVDQEPRRLPPAWPHAAAASPRRQSAIG